MKYYRIEKSTIEQLPKQYKDNVLIIHLSSLKDFHTGKYLAVYHLDSYRVVDPHHYTYYFLKDITDEDLTHLTLISIKVIEISHKDEITMIEEVIANKTYRLG